jgi:hypothetical protein
MTPPAPALHPSKLIRYQYLSLAVVIAAVFFDLLVIARHSPLGTDELMARISAQSVSLGRMFTLLRSYPANVDAPVFPVLAYCASRLPLPIDMAIRVPSMVAMCVAVIALFFLVRERLDIGAAYMTTLLLAVSPYARFGAVARPYAVLLALVSIALLCWCRAVDNGSKRRIWLTGLGISSTAALLTQYLAPLALLPIGAGEILRSWRRRKIDWSVWAALTVGLLIFIPVYLLFAPAGRPYGAHPFRPINVMDLKESFKDAVYPDAVTVLTVLVGVLAIPFRDSPSVRSFFSHEWLAIIGMMASPLPTFAVAGLVAHTYSSRHGICTLVGTTVILASCINRVAKERTAVLFLAFVIGFAATQRPMALMVRQPAYLPQSAWVGATPELLRTYSNLPLITPDFDYAMRIHFYAPSWLSSRLIMIINRESMVKYTGTDNTALAALAIHRWTGWPLVDYFSFRRQHQQFLMYGSYWMLDALKADGAIIKDLGKVGPYPLFLVNAPLVSKASWLPHIAINFD